MKITGKNEIGMFCKKCRKHTSKTVKYLRRRIRDNKLEFYCSRKCADKVHSEKMKGVNNPNYEGKWHGESPSEWSVEKRKIAVEKMRETVLRNGSNKGENNGRWAGGFTVFDCVICGIKTKKRPYVTRLIKSGEQKPTCSEGCTLKLARRNIKQERTSIEVKMAEELQKRDIDYIEQYNLGDKFRLDFLLPEYGIVIECDGDYWHNLPEVKTRDKSKNAYIKACGYSLCRFWESEINESVESCVDIVLAEINEIEAIS